MRLLRLVAYSLLGLAIYEFIQGIYQEPQASESPRSRQQKRRGGARKPARQNITGPGEGQDMDVAGAGGSVERERVGRGVVR